MRGDHPDRECDRGRGEEDVDEGGLAAAAAPIQVARGAPDRAAVENADGQQVDQVEQEPDVREREQ